MKKRQIRKWIWMYVDWYFEEHLDNISKTKRIRRLKTMMRIENQIRAKNLYKYQTLVDDLHCLVEAINDYKEGLNPF